MSAPRCWPAVVAACCAGRRLVDAGSRHGTPSSATPAAGGSVRLGPEPGEDVAAYLARLPATLPPDGARAPALVQLGAEATAPDALAAVDGTTPRDGGVPRAAAAGADRAAVRRAGARRAAATALDNARVRAQRAAAAERRHCGSARRGGGGGGAGAGPRRVSVRARAGRRRRPGRARRGRGAGGGAGGGGGPAGHDRGELALAPLLPEQTVRADPPPDDGPVPAAP